MKFSKYQSLGNSFVVVHYCQELQEHYPALAQIMCNCHTGVGADGLIAVDLGQNTPKMLLFNADGSRATMCGNGLRCVALFCSEQNSQKNYLNILTDDGTKSIEILSQNPFVCRTALGPPKLFGVDAGLVGGKIWGKEVFLDDTPTKIFCVNTGVLHTVILFDRKAKNHAKRISELPFFTEKSNVDFVEALCCEKLLCSTYEKGVGWTPACGTGAAASAYVCFCLGLCGRSLTVNYEYGQLCVEILDENIILTGDAQKVFEGEIKNPYLEAKNEG